ncbi:DUF202 domain-containing protein [Actinomadura sp. KC345]|uniref:DUF202 domain-containing protein n=1 Tax=Actinomadura sp. KC345 TaxID=2530371 RepID=UPI0014044EEE|nr:DUF202 domain-containing protein [Actinomadura sp. KC345]
MSGEAPGLQAERTRLSWDRTGLAFSTYGALLLHAGHLPGVAVILSGFAVLVLGRRRYHRVAGCVRRGEPVPRPRVLACVAALATGTVVLSAAVSFTGPAGH